MATSPKGSSLNENSEGYMPGAFPDPADSLQTSQQTLSQAIYERRSEYTKPRQIKIKIGSWNVGNHSCMRDIGAWFADGKGVEAALTGLAVSDDGKGDQDQRETLESVEDQEARQKLLNKIEPTVPRNDAGDVAIDSDDVGIYVLGLQEVVDVTSPSEALRPYTDPSTANKYKDAVRHALPRGYKLEAEQQLIGLLLLVYVSPKFTDDVSFVSTTSVGTGLMGYMGNKGAVTARLVLGESTRLVFINCHLGAGADKTALERRNWDAGQIIARTRFDPIDAPIGIPSNGGEGIGLEDFAFWFGDLNYRLESIPGDDVRRLLMLHTRNEYDISQSAPLQDASNKIAGDEDGKSSTSVDSAHSGSTGVSKLPKDGQEHIPEEVDPVSLQTTLDSLLPHDELHQQIKMRKAFHEGWKEGPIKFLPTYKYDVGSVGVFDSSDKKRGPSWCDRILYRTRNDYQAYKTKAQEEEEARKKDEEMKARGIEEDENVLFDYNPDEDGEEYDEGADAQAEEEITNSADDDLVLEHYISHQRVLSSDHKPLDAIFTLTYPTVVPELKSKIHNEVVKDLDRKENEGRPTVTVIIDRTSRDFDEPSSDEYIEGVMHFGAVGLGKNKHRVCTVANTGQVPAKVSFVDRPANANDSKEEGPLPPWLLVNFDREPDPKDKKAKGPQPLVYTIEPGDACTIDFTAHVDAGELANDLGDGSVHMDDVLILRVMNGRDHFLPVQARWVGSSLDRTIDKLKSLPESGFRKLQHQKPNSPESPRSVRSLFSRSDPS